ncbi:MAG: glycine--tRNA ligase subunit beta [Chloroflexi bacterium]|nr:glycine--tRNA ligase subunit beta [Chloroflexota bacterium]
MSDKLSFNEVILRLLDYWKAQGCLVWQPYYVQVGAGTMNPATVLRVLGPEPWNVVYVEPSIRPDDGRFGDNPNRMQQHYQLQVILKPDPGNPQELYLKSLEAIGINPREHDIRFVEDNWESPALGAWGLGWEVWLDGQEITQFTYFQQAGGINLDPVSVEITYGLDRIVLALQKARSVWEMEYGAGVMYGDALLEAEIEHCKYYFNVADIDALKAVYDIYEGEAKRCIEAGLVNPAHDYNLKCSHLFNVLDTRGAVGVTERAKYFQRMRNVAKQISELYLAQRHRLEYPFLDNEQWADKAAAAAPHTIQLAQIETPQTFLLEIGSEELPADDLTSALAQLRTSVPGWLAALRIGYERLEIHGSPRRLAVIVHGMQGRQTDLEMEVKGPPADRAFDFDGNPTKAAEGFARGKGVNVKDLFVLDDGKGRYVAARVFEAGRPSAQVLAENLADWVASLKFPKSMRWNRSNISFSRPLRWLVALYGPDVIPFTYAGVLSGRVSRGLRPYDSPDIMINDAAAYLDTLRENGLVVEMAERKAMIERDAAALAQRINGMIPADPGLLEEVTNLVEKPTAFVGRFEDKYLALPAEVLVAVMRKHQRYFPVYAENGKLLPSFIAIRNGDDQHLDIVADGNEQVIRARFADADFFYNRDIKRTLADFVPDLDKLTFQFDLGSMGDKVRRLEQLTPFIGEQLGLSEAEMAVARRAAALSKADLATEMVVEMTSLQGVMGGHYAQRSGESAEVASALAELYNAVSHSRPSLALALADRLDSLVGLFAAGLAPKGSNDPFALRRAALHLIENLISNQVATDLRSMLRHAGSLLPMSSDEKTVNEVLAFIAGRLEGVLREKGYATTLVKAVLAELAHNPYKASLVAHDLTEAVQATDWDELLTAYARCVRITRTLPTHYALRTTDFTLPAEKALAEAYGQVAAANPTTIPAFLNALRQLTPAINAFFDGVLVMDEDQAVRENRLALLQHIAHLSHDLADFSQLEGF